jgi:hypothetical protein
MLTGVHKTQRMTSALIFFERHHEDCDEFLIHIVQVTGVKRPGREFDHSPPTSVKVKKS